MQFEIEEASAGLRRPNCSALGMFLPVAIALEAIALEAIAPEAIALAIAPEDASGGSRRRMGDGE